MSAAVAATLKFRRPQTQAQPQQQQGGFMARRRQLFGGANDSAPSQPTSGWWTRDRPAAAAASRPGCCQSVAGNGMCAKHQRLVERLSHLLSITHTESRRLLIGGGSLLQCAQTYLQSIETSEVVASSIIIEAERLDVLEQIRDILNVDDVKARELLRSSDWNLARAIEKFIPEEEAPRAAPAPARHHHYQHQQQYYQQQHPTTTAAAAAEPYRPDPIYPALQDPASFQYESYHPSAPPRPIVGGEVEMGTPVVGIAVEEEVMMGSPQQQQQQQAVTMQVSPPQATMWQQQFEIEGQGPQLKLSEEQPLLLAAEWGGMPQWLESHGLGQYVGVFEEQELTDAESICLLSDEDVKALIPTLGGRKKAHHAIAALRAKQQQ